MTPVPRDHPPCTKDLNQSVPKVSRDEELVYSHVEVRSERSKYFTPMTKNRLLWVFGRQEKEIEIVPTTSFILDTSIKYVFLETRFVFSILGNEELHLYFFSEIILTSRNLGVSQGGGKKKIYFLQGRPTLLKYLIMYDTDDRS